MRILCNPRFAGGEFDTNEGLAMLSALTQLSNHQFWPLDLPFAEVANILGITENNAKVHFHHAVRRLREWLGGGVP